MNFFSSISHISTTFTQDIDGLLFTKWICFNDVNVGWNILINSQLKRILFESSGKKKWNTWERQKNMGKGDNSDESDFNENEIPDLNSLKPFEFEPKVILGDINSSNSDDEEEGVEYKVKRISTRE